MQSHRIHTVPRTDQRVPLQTSAASNARILEDTKTRLRNIGFDRAKIDARLGELEKEWDIERVLEANAATASLIGLSLGATVSRKWFLFPAVVAGFLFQHALQGWCPPLPVFRRLGVRTSHEIDAERTVLKARRGDLEGIATKDEGEALRVLAS